MFSLALNNLRLKQLFLSCVCWGGAEGVFVTAGEIGKGGESYLECYFADGFLCAHKECAGPT